MNYVFLYKGGRFAFEPPEAATSPATADVSSVGSVAVASSSSALARVDEYADEFNLNDIGLAMFLSAYRPLG